MRLVFSAVSVLPQPCLLLSFDYILANHTMKTIRLAHATGRPWMIYAGWKKPHAPWGSPSRMYELYEPLEEKVRLPRNQFRPRRSPNISSIGDFFLRLDNGTFDDIYPWGPDQAAPDEVVLRNRQACAPHHTLNFADPSVSPHGP